MELLNRVEFPTIDTIIPFTIHHLDALKRHETFNGLTKFFDCLSGRFRHSVDRFKNCFEAVCVICQYQVELGNPLYDILIPDLIED
jgi:hypothetical protein